MLTPDNSEIIRYIRRNFRTRAHNNEQLPEYWERVCKELAVLIRDDVSKLNGKITHTERIADMKELDEYDKWYMAKFGARDVVRNDELIKEFHEAVRK